MRLSLIWGVAKALGALSSRSRSLHLSLLQSRNIWNQRRRCALKVPVARAIMKRSENTEFTGRSETELAAWLGSKGIDTSLYGKGTSKPVQFLLQEISDGESVLTAEASGIGVRRRVSVVNVSLRNSRGMRLYEAQQVLPTGVVRSRGLPLSEKMLPGESWCEAAVRGVTEELGPILPGGVEVVVDEATYNKEEEIKQSQSYPGLETTYECHRVDARVEGLPEENFVTTEERADGALVHVWEWR